MIDLAALLNTDALSTFRDALESHVFFRLSDHHYRDNNHNTVTAPASDNAERHQEIVACCELAKEIDAVLESQSWLSTLLDTIDADERTDTVYRCTCSWVGGDPDIGPGRKIRAKVLPPSRATCPACWAHDKKRAVVVEQCPKCRGPARECNAKQACLHCRDEACAHIFWPGQPDASGESYAKYQKRGGQ